MPMATLSEGSSKSSAQKPATLSGKGSTEKSAGSKRTREVAEGSQLYSETDSRAALRQTIDKCLERGFVPHLHNKMRQWKAEQAKGSEESFPDFCTRVNKEESKAWWAEEKKRQEERDPDSEEESQERYWIKMCEEDRELQDLGETDEKAKEHQRQKVAEFKAQAAQALAAIEKEERELYSELVQALGMPKEVTESFLANQKEAREMRNFFEVQKQKRAWARTLETEKQLAAENEEKKVTQSKEEKAEAGKVQCCM